MPNSHSRATPLTTPRFSQPRFLRRSLLAIWVTGAATTAGAQQQEPTNPSWLDGVRAQCEQQYSVEQCADHDFLDEHFHVDSLRTAHRTATQRHVQEDRVLRELLLQRACNNRKAYCAQNAAVGCAEQLTQMCTAIAQQAAACLSQAKQYCATFPQNRDCLKQRQAQCPSAKKQSIDVLLAKYPKLSAQQQENVRLVARKLDANLGGSWLGDLIRSLGF